MFYYYALQLKMLCSRLYIKKNPPAHGKLKLISLDLFDRKK